MENSPLRKMGWHALVVALSSLLGKGLGFVKEIIVAFTFGVAGALDIYLMAFILIGFPLSILLNAIQTALICEISSDNSGTSFIGSLYLSTASFTLFCLAVVLPFWLLLIPSVLPWMASGFSIEKKQGLEMALNYLIPYYFLSAINILGYGVLQARARYLVNGLLPSITPITIIIFLLFYGAKGDWLSLVLGLVFGAGIESIALLAIIHKAYRLSMFQSYEWSRLKTVVSASLMLMPGTIILAIGPVVDQAIAASLGNGSNAVLGYGLKLPSALQAIFVTAIGVTALPYFTAQLANDRISYSLHSLNKLFRWLLLGGAIMVVPLAFFSKEIISLLFQRGAFDFDAAIRVAPIQFAYFVQLPFALIAMLGVKVLASLRLHRLMSFYTIVAVIVKSILAYYFGLIYGLVGIAWSAVIGSVLLAVMSYVTARSTLLRKVR